MNTEAKDFYKSLARIVAPIAIQNLISAAVSSVDVIMLGSVGQTAIAASSLAGQIVFILFMITVGLSSGLGMLCAQYWGKKDLDSIRTLTGIALRISLTVGVVFGLAAMFTPHFLMKIFTSDPNLIETGVIYLRVVGFSYIFMSITQTFCATFKSVEKVKIATALTFIALGTNVFLNAFFIYGLFGVPKLGIMGVGIATSISRALELAICLVYAARQQELRLTMTVLFRRSKELTHDFFKYSLPALGNELVWGAAFSMYSVILGHLGEDIVAANSVVNVVRNLATIICFGMAYGGAILLGKTIGAGDMALAERNGSRLVRSTIAAGLLGGLAMICMYPIMPLLAHLSETAAHYRNILLFINSYSIVGATINTVLICGIFRAGGDSKFGFILDACFMWGVAVPVGLICAFVLKLPPLTVYFILFLDEFVKMPPSVIHYFKKGWLRDITR
ncbi:MATE family efflux transporter [Treponema sp. C6A8]|uniref:MATE family efflux transporter n=1 Tax=Treponema sp. C6A8 TaxID=1410609 RepID=UPI00048029C2|nr:MATE family efflux transporter [Treponema sp. C6A8]